MKKIINLLGGYTLLSFAIVGFTYSLERVRKNVRCRNSNVKSVN